MLIEIHMIQNHSPANLNRDDLGAPKTCYFGGYLRSRISSQCLKRSIRKPGNSDDSGNVRPGIFAEAMQNYMGIRTKLFPWLVAEELKTSTIPADLHSRVVKAAQRIGTSAEKVVQEKKRVDSRPMTNQLIHLGPTHAQKFVSKLSELSKTLPDEFEYFMSPIVGFQEQVKHFLIGLGLDEEEKDHEKIVKSAWVIETCRRKKLAEYMMEEDTEEFGETTTEEEAAEFIAKALERLRSTNPKGFRELTKAPNKGEKEELKEESPKKPSKMSQFYKELKQIEPHDAVDIALFGRMVTSDAFENIEASMQVSSAISTNIARPETDYFTAVDDLAKGTGSAHLGEAMYASACFYKYFSLDWNQLLANLSGQKENGRPHDAVVKLAGATLGHFIRAAALTSPSGKQNSHASHCEPCGILVEIKQNNPFPTSYANAFAQPVEASGKVEPDSVDESSLEGRSVSCLGEHVQAIRNAYGIDSKLFWYSPKLWRFPLRYWEREKNGRKVRAKLLVQDDDCFDKLGGTSSEMEGLIEAVVKEVTGLKWQEVRSAGKRELSQ